jgi:uncharacterized alkaline shock family protein YloU
MIEKSELGIVRISKKAIADIATRAALDVKGVTGIGGGFLFEVCRFLKIDSFFGIKIEILGNGDVIITLPVTVGYGVDVSGISSEVQEKVKKSVEEMTNLEVVKIDVNIDGIK